MIERVTGRTSAAPAPAGPYSQSVRLGDLVFCSGQAGINLQGVLVDGIEAQTRQTLLNIAATLASVEASMDDVAHVRVYLTEVAHFETLNRVYLEFFQRNFPARTTVYVALPAGMLVEIDAVAVSPVSRG